ncbi:hypothetical protein HLB35_01370 [Halomonas sp. TBZ9]|uniref:Uncharacterized protein n=1 Tax=Vreelandella azerica TaxID=2732867 RepID=A0A7Y3TVF3_9GAMM|nr:hypothetical protein [Halomonas azerica]NOG30755.1 hypothetical protein [Halomonas azerica]
MQNASSDELRAKLSQLISTTRQGVLAGYPLRHVRVGDTQHSRNLAALANQPDSGVTRISVPLDPTERIRFVRQWMEKHQRKLASGALASTLVLPMLALIWQQFSGRFFKRLLVASIHSPLDSYSRC